MGDFGDEVKPKKKELPVVKAKEKTLRSLQVNFTIMQIIYMWKSKLLLHLSIFIYLSLNFVISKKQEYKTASCSIFTETTPRVLINLVEHEVACCSL